MTKKKLKAKLEEKCDLYFDLVWYARKDKTHLKQPGRQGIERIQRDHPAEVAALSGRDSSWHHGFNSGCLAMVRLALGLMGAAEDAEMAEEEFPVLDT